MNQVLLRGLKWDFSGVCVISNSRVMIIVSTQISMCDDIHIFFILVTSTIILELN